MPLMQSTICKQWKIPDLWWLLYTLNPWATFKVFISSIDWPLRSLDRDEKRCNERSRLFLLLWFALLFSWKFNDFHTYRRKIGWPPSSIYVEWLVEKFWLCYILLLLSFLTFMVMKIGLIHYILQFLHPFQMSSAWSYFHNVWKSLKKSHYFTTLRAKRAKFSVPTKTNQSRNLLRNVILCESRTFKWDFFGDFQTLWKS